MKNKIIKVLDSIRGKVVFFFLLSILFIGCVTWQCQKYFLLVSVQDEEEAYIREQAAQIVSAVQTDKENCENFLRQLCFNTNLPVYLSNEYTDYVDVWESVSEIRYLVKERIAMMPCIKKLRIYHSNSTFCEDGRNLFFSPTERITEIPFMVWNAEGDGEEAICDRIRGMYQGKEAYINLIYDTNYVFGHYAGAEGITGWEYYIFDENWHYVSGTDGMYGRELDTASFQILKAGETIRDKERQLLTLREKTSSGWNVVVQYPMSQNRENKTRAGRTIFGILMIYCLIAGSLLVFYLERMISRIYRIGKNLEKIGSRKLNFMKQMHGHDEISQLEKQYNSMLNKLEQTIDEMAEIKNKRQQMEIKVLESQINPHFLYNTLGVMRWKAVEAENAGLCEIIDNMTTFYRLSLNKGQGLISVKKEMELISAYVALQQYRYDNCVKYKAEVKESVLEVMMPKMILQPLVENIYLHADIVLEEYREIRIKIEKQEEMLLILVYDNGRGMTEEELYNVNHNINLSEEHGVGISFIYSSLQVFYGNAGKMEFMSKLGEGTCVKISFPLEPVYKPEDEKITKGATGK